MGSTGQVEDLVVGAGDGHGPCCLLGVWCGETWGCAYGDVPQSGVWGPVSCDDAFLVVEHFYCGGGECGCASTVTELA